MGGGEAGAILLLSELRVAHLNAKLIFNLLNAQLGLPVLEFRAHVRCLRGTVAERNVNRDARAFVGSSGIDELVQGAAIADRGCRVRRTTKNWRVLVYAEVRGILVPS